MGKPVIAEPAGMSNVMVKVTVPPTIWPFTGLRTGWTVIVPVPLAVGIPAGGLTSWADDIATVLDEVSTSLTICARIAPPGLVDVCRLTYQPEGFASSLARTVMSTLAAWRLVNPTP